MCAHPQEPPPARDSSRGGSDPGSLAATFCATLVDEWVALGITDAVLCPGSRNTPVTVALATDERLRTHVVHDERSAAFMALGLGLATGRPAPLTCTSGSAPTHFHPAVVEADLAAVPMILVTADRPPELQGVLAPQTINQRDLYGSAVRWYCEPGPPAPGSSPWWRDLAFDAVDRATGAVPGPVHLNLAFREPLTGTAGELPPGREPVAERGRVRAAAPGTPWQVTDEDVARLLPQLSARRGVVAAGARAARSSAEARSVLEFADMLGWPVLATPQSGLHVEHDRVVTPFDPVLRSGLFDSHAPEVVVRIGGLVASRPATEWLAGASDPGRPTPLTIAVDRYGLCPDPDSTVARRFTCTPGDFAARFAGLGAEPAPRWWTDTWAAAASLTRSVLAGQLEADRTAVCDEPSTAAAVMAAAPVGSEVFVSSSMPVRDLESFAAPREGVRVHSNRGTNGIDGSIATATGIAMGSDRPVVALCGDLAFLHDVGSLSGLAGRGVELTVVVIDNDGGGIFSFLPQAGELPEPLFERAFGTPHGQDLVRVARSFGLPAEEVGTRGELLDALGPADGVTGPRVVVVRSDRRANVAFHRGLQDRVSAALGELRAPGA